jgi:hypothetical protein
MYIYIQLIIVMIHHLTMAQPSSRPSSAMLPRWLVRDDLCRLDQTCRCGLTGDRNPQNENVVLVYDMYIQYIYMIHNIYIVLVFFVYNDKHMIMIWFSIYVLLYMAGYSYMIMGGLGYVYVNSIHI